MPCRWRSSLIPATVAVGVACLMLVGSAAQPTVVRVNAFFGAQNLPLFVGFAQGVFEKHGLKVDLQFTPNSDAQREGLAAGAFDIAHGAVDNAVAMVEVAAKDVVIVLGGDSSMNELFVRPDIGSVAQLRGKTLLVDAPNTAYALQAKKILLNAGLRAGDYQVKVTGATPIRLKALLSGEGEAAIVNAPFSIAARQQGMKNLGRTVDLLGPYQGTGAFVMRAWAKAHNETLERYIAAYVESLRWALAPANRDASIAILTERLKVERAVATETYDLERDPTFGLVPDARFSLDGFKALLALRAEIEGQWGGKPPAPERYYDLQYYERGLRRIGR